jgi:hypothetical protein
MPSDHAQKSEDPIAEIKISQAKCAFLKNPKFNSFQNACDEILSTTAAEYQKGNRAYFATTQNTWQTMQANPIVREIDQASLAEYDRRMNNIQEKLATAIPAFPQQLINVEREHELQRQAQNQLVSKRSFDLAATKLKILLENKISNDADKNSITIKNTYAAVNDALAKPKDSKEYQSAADKIIEYQSLLSINEEIAKNIPLPEILSRARQQETAALKTLESDPLFIDRRPLKVSLHSSILSINSAKKNIQKEYESNDKTQQIMHSLGTRTHVQLQNNKNYQNIPAIKSKTLAQLNLDDFMQCTKNLNESERSAEVYPRVIQLAELNASKSFSLEPQLQSNERKAKGHATSPIDTFHSLPSPPTPMVKNSFLPPIVNKNAYTTTELQEIRSQDNERTRGGSFIRPAPPLNNKNSSAAPAHAWRNSFSESDSSSISRNFASSQASSTDDDIHESDLVQSISIKRP